MPVAETKNAKSIQHKKSRFHQPFTVPKKSEQRKKDPADSKRICVYNFVNARQHAQKNEKISLFLQTGSVCQFFFSKNQTSTAKNLAKITSSFPQEKCAIFFFRKTRLAPPKIDEKMPQILDKIFVPAQLVPRLYFLYFFPLFSSFYGLKLDLWHQNRYRRVPC